ncbi:DUF881 domain-containing protein [Syntrophomonas sp.]|uniref:DUF881 domain-containing protein n=1 Tax=Syntrophomonas sp. TaxID=2053627 RepID=UPI003457CB8B
MVSTCPVIDSWINELIKAGAEAISINDERLIASSEIECSGDKIRINGTTTGLFSPVLNLQSGNSAKFFSIVAN